MTLSATPAPGSRFTGWSGSNCSGTDTCHPNTTVNGQTATATFGLLPWGGAAAVPGASALNLGGDAQVTSVSCTGSQSCSAGGYYRDSSGYQPFVADEVSGVWRHAVKVPGTAALNLGSDARVTSISCASPGSCAAGGYYRDRKGGYQAFVVKDVGGVWRMAVEVRGTAVLNAGKNARVTSISCAGLGNCSAGGTYYSRGGSQQVFVLNEKHGVWEPAIKVPRTAALNVGGNASLTAISCGAPGRCAAGGYYRDAKGGNQAFLVDEKSGVWGKAVKLRGRRALYPTVGNNVQVTAVSCATAKFCAAGGTYKDNSGETQSFLVTGGPNMRGNWVWDKAFVVYGIGSAQLTSISCAAAGDCAAAGGFSGPDGNEPFVVDSIGGYWFSAIAVPGIAGLGSSSADAISCSSPGNCTVTGSDSTGPGVFVASQTNYIWSTAGNVVPPSGANALHVTSLSCAKTGDTCAIGGSYTDGSSHTQPFVTGAP
jgi:hypothetical protein